MPADEEQGLLSREQDWGQHCLAYLPCLGSAVLLGHGCGDMHALCLTCTGMRPSGRPVAAVRKMLATSPMLEEIM